MAAGGRGSVPTPELAVGRHSPAMLVSQGGYLLLGGSLQPGRCSQALVMARGGREETRTPQLLEPCLVPPLLWDFASCAGAPR